MAAAAGEKLMFVNLLCWENKETDKSVSKYYIIIYILFIFNMWNF